MAKKRAKVDIDFTQQAAGLFDKTEPETAPKKATSDRKDERATYYIDPAVRERVRALSVAWGVSQSQAAWYLLLYGLAAHDGGDLPDPPLTPSSSPAYRHNIEFDKVGQ
jgi:hypothetical protein